MAMTTSVHRGWLRCAGSKGPHSVLYVRGVSAPPPGQPPPCSSAHKVPSPALPVFRVARPRRIAHHCELAQRADRERTDDPPRRKRAKIIFLHVVTTSAGSENLAAPKLVFPLPVETAEGPGLVGRERELPPPAGLPALM